MKKLPFELLLVLAASLSAVSAVKPSDVVGKSAVFACSSLLAGVRWDFESSEGPWAVMCIYEPAFGSWTTCIDENIRDLPGRSPEQYAQAVKDSTEFMNRVCSHGSSGSNLNAITPARFGESLRNASDFLSSEMPPNTTVDYPVELDGDTRRKFSRGLAVYFANSEYSRSVSMYIIWYVIAITVMGLLWRHGLQGVRARVLQFRIIQFIRGRIVLPPLSEKHAQPVKARHGGGLVPTRLELSIIVGYTLVHTLIMVAWYSYDYEKVLEPTYMQFWRFFADRIGILAFAQVPLIIIFAGRNSFFEELTGLKYTTSIVLHKWIGRYMFLDAWLHAGAFKYHAQLSVTLEESEKEPYWKNGVYALIMCFLLCTLSIGVLRRRFYETFLYGHIAFAVLCLYFTWKHVHQFGWAKWVWVSTGIWIFEKLMRLRLIWNYGIGVKAEAKLFGTDIVQLRIPKPPSVKFEPAQYAFIYFLLPKVFWQSHPFTVIDRGTHLLAVIKGKTGATGALLDHVKANGGKATLRVCVEGPYGESSPIQRFDNQLFLCGGSGIPGPLAYMLEDAPSNTTFVVVTRHPDLLQAFSDELTIAGAAVNVQAYVTSASMYGSTDISSLPVAAEWGRRPDLYQLLTSSSHLPGSLAVTCCGPPVFVDEARSLVANAIKADSAIDIEYFEEYQTW